MSTVSLAVPKDWSKLQRVAGWGVLAATALAPFFLGTGYDFLVHYRPAGWGDANATWLLPWGYWLIKPFAILPEYVGLLLWSVLGVAGLGWLAYRYQNNPALVGLSFPFLYMVGNGQIEGLLAGGLALALVANPWAAGLGLAILSIKPQVGGLVALVIFLRRRDWRVLVAPFVVLALSILVYGWWFGPWLGRIAVNVVDLNKTGWNVSLFPWSALLAAPLVWRARRSLRAMLIFPAFLSPYYGVYSLALPLAMVKISPLSWLLMWLAGVVYVVFPALPALAFIPLILLWNIRHEIF